MPGICGHESVKKQGKGAGYLRAVSCRIGSNRVFFVHSARVEIGDGHEASRRPKRKFLGLSISLNVAVPLARNVSLSSTFHRPDLDLGLSDGGRREDRTHHLATNQHGTENRSRSMSQPGRLAGSPSTEAKGDAMVLRRGVRRFVIVHAR